MKPRTFNYMTYQQIIEDIPSAAYLLKPYSPLNDDALREKVITHLLSKGFVFGEDIPEIKPVIRKRGHKYYLDQFGIEYERLKHL